MKAWVKGMHRSVAASAALLTLLSIGLCLCSEASGAASTCHNEAAAVRMTADCCCGEFSVVTAVSVTSDTRAPESAGRASLAPRTEHPLRAPELSTVGSPCSGSTGEHSPPSLLRPPLRN